MATDTPVLSLYSQDTPTIVSSDASSRGIGGVLLQVQEDGRRAPIYYVSRSLNTTEQRYSQIKKETLAMAWSCERFQCYLFGRDTPFQVDTDHKPLLSIMNSQSLDQCPPRLQHLRLRMMQYYYYNVVYVHSIRGNNLSSQMPCPAAQWKSGFWTILLRSTCLESKYHGLFQTKCCCVLRRRQSTILSSELFCSWCNQNGLRTKNSYQSS